MPRSLCFTLTLRPPLEINIGQVLNGSLQEIIDPAVTAALVGWVAIVVKNKFNIDIEAKHRDALTTFLSTTTGFRLVAVGAVKLEGVKVEVQSEALAAANTALAAIPGALVFFGLEV